MVLSAAVKTVSKHTCVSEQADRGAVLAGFEPVCLELIRKETGRRCPISLLLHLWMSDYGPGTSLKNVVLPLMAPVYGVVVVTSVHGPLSELAFCSFGVEKASESQATMI